MEGSSGDDGGESEYSGEGDDDAGGKCIMMVVMVIALEKEPVS